MAVEKLEGEVTWLDAEGEALNIEDVKVGIHIIRAMSRKLKMSEISLWFLHIAFITFEPRPKTLL